MNMTVFRPTPLRFFIFLLLQGLIYCSLYSTLFPPIVLYVIISLISSALYCILAWKICSDEVDVSRFSLVLIVVAGVVFRVIQLSHAPVGSDDIYRYIWDGKIQCAGIDPYRYEPINPALQTLRSALLPAKITFPEMKTIYPPLAEWFFAVVYAGVGESVTGFRIALLVVELASMSFILVILRKWEKPLKYISLYALCPLPVLQFALDGHCDVLIFPFLLGMLFFFSGGRKIVSYCMLGFAAIVKIYPVLFLPAFLLREQKKYRFAAILLPLLIILFAYFPSILVRSNPFESLKIFSLNWAANGLIFELCYMILRNNQYAHIVMVLLFSCWLIFVLRRNRSFAETVYEILLGFFLFSATVHPWYLTSLVVMLPLVPRKSGIVLAALSSFATVPLISYVLLGRWQQSIWLMMLEYLPVYYLVWREFRPRPLSALERTSPI